MGTYKVIPEYSPNDPPKDFEMRAANIFANYLKKDLIFKRAGHRRTPDLKEIDTGIVWELKSPIGDGKKTIDNNLRTASRQSSRVILDLSRCKMHQSKVISRVRNYVSYPGHKFEKIIIITKSRKIIDFFENL